MVLQMINDDENDDGDDNDYDDDNDDDDDGLLLEKVFITKTLASRYFLCKYDPGSHTDVLNVCGGSKN